MAQVSSNGSAQAWVGSSVCCLPHDVHFHPEEGLMGAWRWASGAPPTYGLLQASELDRLPGSGSFQGDSFMGAV